MEDKNDPLDGQLTTSAAVSAGAGLQQVKREQRAAGQLIVSRGKTLTLSVLFAQRKYYLFQVS